MYGFRNISFHPFKELGKLCDIDNKRLSALNGTMKDSLRTPTRGAIQSHGDSLY